MKQTFFPPRLFFHKTFFLDTFFPGLFFRDFFFYHHYVHIIIMCEIMFYSVTRFGRSRNYEKLNPNGVYYYLFFNTFTNSLIHRSTNIYLLTCKSILIPYVTYISVSGRVVLCRYFMRDTLIKQTFRVDD